jgi:pre-mRNA-processing factor 40
MSAIITDPRYHLLSTIGEKKQAFNEYASSRSREEKIEERDRRRSSAAAFTQMLEDCAQLSPTTTWLEACGMLENDPRFGAVENVRDREDIFAEHTHKLVQQARNRERQLRNDDMARLRDKMKSQDWLNLDSTWRQAKTELAEEATFTGLGKIDALRVFEDLMHEMHRAEEQSRARKRVLARRAERKARTEFRTLLAEAKQAGTIIAGSSWASCKPVLQKDPRFLANDGRAGSTACELFDDLREVRLNR